MKRKHFIGKLWHALGVLVLLLLSHGAHAAGSCTSSPTMPYMQTMNNMAVAANLAVGATIPGTVRNYTFSGQCVAAGNNAIYAGAQIVSCYYGSGTEVMPGVYSTGVAGIGIRLRNSAGQAMQNASGIWCDTRSAGLGTLAGDLSYSVSVSVEFVKTGTIVGGALDPAQTRFGFGVYNSAVGLGGSGGATNYIGFDGNATPREIACNVNAPTTVALPSVKATTLAGTGSTAGSTAFSIRLNCDGAALVGITFDAALGASVKSAANGVLGIVNEGTGGAASGVGVQLVNAQTLVPVPLQTRNQLGNITANTSNTYAYAFRYYSLSSNPTAGTVNGAAVFTFDYQ